MTALHHRYGCATRTKALTLGEARRRLYEQETNPSNVFSGGEYGEQDETEIAQAFTQRADEERTAEAHARAAKAHATAANAWFASAARDREPHAKKIAEAHELVATWHRDQAK